MVHSYGRVCFIDGEFAGECLIRNAISRGSGEIVFEFDYGLPGRPDIYLVALVAVGSDQLEGQFSAGSGGNAVSGRVSCRQYRAARGLALAGEWYEDGNCYPWFAEVFPRDKSTV